jgi:hypothetical protein
MSWASDQIEEDPSIHVQYMYTLNCSCSLVRITLIYLIYLIFDDLLDLLDFR